MGSVKSSEKTKRRGRPLGKINASLNERLRNVKWGEFKIGDVLEKVETAKINLKKADCPTTPQGKYVLPARTATAQNQGLSCYVPINCGTVLKNKISVSANGDYCAFWHDVSFTILQDSYALKGKNFELDTASALFIISQMNHVLLSKYNWGNKSRWEKIKENYIRLPIKENWIDFNFMESFIAELEAERVAELSAYLKVSGLDNYELSGEEESVLKSFQSLKWDTYNLERLFGKSTRGKRLKGDDRIAGTLPFVTAGEASEGVSAYISNDVEVFEKNTTTIDMFGSAKYRNYRYGADDHVAVVHTEAVPMKAAIFVTSACHKAAHTGKFDYGHNFYAKDADALNIQLPIKNGKPDYETMETLISAIQKSVIKDVVLYADKKIETTKYIIDKQ